MPCFIEDMQSRVYPDNQQKLIEYRNISVIQSKRTVLDNINLSIKSGENVAILGPNGAGKSFLIKTITRENYPVSGMPDSYLRILGKDNWNIFELRNMLGIVSSNMVKNHALFNTSRETILSGFFSSVGIWSHHNLTPEMEQKTKEVMEQLKISHLRECKMNEMSTGEMQRVLIGRALVHDPRALVLDEPCASLDFRAARELRKMLRRITHRGTSIIMVTHNLTDIIPEITRVILLKDGSIFIDDSKEKALTSESLYHLFEVPLKVHKKNGYYHVS